MGTAVIGAAVTLASSLAQAQSGMELGNSEYLSTCGACHDASGKGDGRFTGSLKEKMPDLTTFLKKSGAVFPADCLMRLIDGRETVRPYEPVSMPIRGTEYVCAGGLPAAGKRPFP